MSGAWKPWPRQKSANDVSEIGIQLGKCLYTADEIARRCQVSPKTIQRWARDGKLKHYILGHRTLRFSEEHVEQFLEQHTEVHELTKSKKGGDGNGNNDSERKA